MIDDGDRPGPAAAYSLVASAIAGRLVGVELSSADVVYTDGQTIFLPEGDLDVNLTGLVAQSALLGAGSLVASNVAHLIGRSTPARRYLTLEVARAINGLGLPAPPLERQILGGHFGGPIPSSASESLRRALSREQVAEAPDSFGTIRPHKLLPSSANAVGLALTRRSRSGAVPEEPVPELDDDSDDSKILKLLSAGFGWENPLFRMLRNQLRMRRRTKPDGQDGGAELPVSGSSVVSNVRPTAALVVAPTTISIDRDGRPSGDLRYPEWDDRRQLYRPNWCCVREFVPAAGDATSGFAPKADYALRRQLAHLGLSYARHPRQADGDDVDVGALVEFAVTKALGETPNERVYVARLRTSHDLGVVVLLDASGSTGQHSRGRSIWDEHRHLAANLVGALEQVGDRVAAYGFNSYGRNQVRFLLIKDFEGRFDRGAIRRLAALEPSGFTRLGAAVRHATHLVLNNAGTANKLLVVVSDGLAYDDGYQGSYAERDTRRALDEAVGQGVGCVCVSVASGTDEATLQRLWGSVTHVQLSSAEALSQHVVPMFRAALKSSSGARRDLAASGTTQADRRTRKPR